MKKTVFTLFVIAALVLSLAACGSAPAAQPQEAPEAEAPLVTDAPQQGAEAAAEQPAAAEATEAPAPSETKESSVNTVTAYRAGGEPVSLTGEDGVFTTEDGVVYYLGNDGMLRARGYEDLYINDLAAKAAAPEGAETAPAIARQDGERFEAVIVMEGMEETVNYEHIRNEALGFEMDYDYESFTRSSEADRERFVLVWDDPANPENYLELNYSPESAEYAAGAISEALSEEYELYRDDSFMLERAGRCIYISASSVKGGGYSPEHVQTVYVIPAGDGCIVATEHCSIESAEGVGRRFAYMMHTLSLIEG